MSVLRCSLLAALLSLPQAAPAQGEAADVEAVATGLCERISGKLASVSLEECLARHLRDSGGRTVTGAPILYKEYPPLQSRVPLGRVLLIGGIHGDEYASVSVVFKWLRTLDRHHSGLFHWRLVPLLNADGLLRPEPRPVNANGVDLNRDFAALSEPETRWLATEIDSFAPDVIVAVHAPHEAADYPAPAGGPYKLGRVALNAVEALPGSLGNYAGVQRRIPVVSIELPYAGIMPRPDEVAGIWRDLVRWLMRRLPEYRRTAAR